MDGRCWIAEVKKARIIGELVGEQVGARAPDLTELGALSPTGVARRRRVAAAWGRSRRDSGSGG